LAEMKHNGRRDIIPFCQLHNETNTV